MLDIRPIYGDGTKFGTVNSGSNNGTPEGCSVTQSAVQAHSLFIIVHMDGKCFCQPRFDLAADATSNARVAYGERPQLVVQFIPIPQQQGFEPIPQCLSAPGPCDTVADVKH